MAAGPLRCQGVAPPTFGAQCRGMGKPDKTREEELAAALRENLRRRKAQSREIARKQGDLKPEDNSAAQGPGASS